MTGNRARPTFWGLLVGTLIIGTLAVRFYRVPAGLRLENHEAVWQAAPYALLAATLVVLALTTRTPPRQ